tara:strand:+ start:1344 stop:1547 length:204 start_codon:yes stop_codon:yes gene_type:complete
MTEVTIDEINGRLEFLTAQRNASQNENAILAGRLHAAQQTIAKLQPEEAEVPESFEEVEDGPDESTE